MSGGSCRTADRQLVADVQDLTLRPRKQEASDWPDVVREAVPKPELSCVRVPKVRHLSDNPPAGHMRRVAQLARRCKTFPDWPGQVTRHEVFIPTIVMFAARIR